MSNPIPRPDATIARDVTTEARALIAASDLFRKHSLTCHAEAIDGAIEELADSEANRTGTAPEDVLATWFHVPERPTDPRFGLEAMEAFGTRAYVHTDPEIFLRIAGDDR